MERRTFWKSLAGIPLLIGFGRHVIAASAESMKAVEDLQKNWKMLLADGTKVPSPANVPAPTATPLSLRVPQMAVPDAPRK